MTLASTVGVGGGCPHPGTITRAPASSGPNISSRDTSKLGEYLNRPRSAAAERELVLHPLQVAGQRAGAPPSPPSGAPVEPDV